MKIQSLKTQTGYVLLLTVLAMMSIGGVVAVGFTQEAKQRVDQQRVLHNKRVLAEAKRALLQYAYNYAVTSGDTQGPGRLPCSDIDNDGESETGFGDCITLGRLPWAEPALDLYDLRDADGQRLWYAVSDAFATNVAGGNSINRDTSGTITVRSPSGIVRFDGSNPDNRAQYGIAAVVIAPGAVIERNGVSQDRSVANGDDPFDYTAGNDSDEDTDPGIISATNYLDLVAGTEDNASFTQNSSADGFIIGRSEFYSSDSVNDQLILITAAEVTAMAEKAVLDTYRNAIDQYQSTIWAVPADYRYPWVNAYSDITDLEVYLVVPGKTIGRVPYLNYYRDHDSHTLSTDLVVDYAADLNLIDSNDPFDQSYINAFSSLFTSGGQIDLSNALVSFKQETFDLSANNSADLIGTMVVTSDAGTVINSPTSATERRYFWDGCATCIEAENGWELCPVNAGDETDCAKDDNVPHNFEPFTDWSNHADIKIRFVELNFSFDADFEIGMDFTNSTSWWNAPTQPGALANATRQAVVPPASVTDLAVDVDGSIADTLDIVDITLINCEQDNFVGDDFNVPSFNPNSGSVFCTPLLDTAVAVTQLDITADYHPELPLWVRTNGWNDSFMLAYADDYKPGGNRDCGANPPCLTLTDDFAGSSSNNVSLILGAGSRPADSADLENIFDNENNAPDEDRNATLNTIFAAHPNGGDDVVLVIDEI